MPRRIPAVVAEVAPPFGHVISCQRVLTGFSLSGLTFGRDHLFYIDVDNRTIYEINKDTMALINSFATLGNNPAGLAWKDENSLWYGDRLSEVVREVNATTGDLISSFDAGFDVNAIAYDGTHLWIGSEDDALIRIFTLAGVLVRTTSAFADVDVFGLTYVDPYLYVMGIWSEGVLIEMDTGVAPLAQIKRYHAMKRGSMPRHGLTWDGEYLRVGTDGDWVNNSLICKVQK
ncbi:hypothetical protein ES702_01801 [subsurface metagenome]